MNLFFTLWTFSSLWKLRFEANICAGAKAVCSLYVQMFFGKSQGCNDNDDHGDEEEEEGDEDGEDGDLEDGDGVTY